MQPTLQPGDNILVNKWTMGAKIFNIWEVAEGKEWKLGNSKTILDFIIVNDSNVVTQDFSGSSRLLQITKENQEGMFSIPTIEEGKGFNAELVYVWRSFMAYNVGLDKIAMATQHGDVIEIYDLKIGILKL